MVRRRYRRRRRPPTFAPFSPSFLRFAGRLAANRRRRRRIVSHSRRPAPELGMDLIRHIFLRCDVFTIVVARFLCRWLRTESQSLQFANDFRQIVHPGIGDFWAITHHFSTQDDRFGFLRMVNHNLDGIVLRIREIRFNTQYSFLTERNLVRGEERMNLLATCENIFVFSLKENGRCVAILLFNLTSAMSSFRLDCSDRPFEVEGFIYTGRFRISVNPLDNLFYLQYFEINSEYSRYYEYRFSRDRDGWRNDGWVTYDIQGVEHLLPGEAEHAMAMGLPINFVTFREGSPIWLNITEQFFMNSLWNPFWFDSNAGGVFTYVGSSSYVIAMIAPRDSTGQSALQSIDLYSLDPYQKAELVSSVPNNLHPREKYHVVGCKVSVVDNAVYFVLTLVKHGASGNLIYRFDTILGLWTRYLDDDFAGNRSGKCGSTFILRLTL